MKTGIAVPVTESYVGEIPDELMNAIMSMEAAYQSMVRQALNSDAIRAAMLASMLAKGGSWEAFGQRSGAAGHT